MFENLRRKIKLAFLWVVSKGLIFVNDTRGTMKFDIMGIVLMMVAIVAGTFIGNMIGTSIGFLGGGLIGALVVGFIVYLVWALLNGKGIDIMDGVLFSVMVYLSQIIQNALSGLIGFGGSILGLFFSAVILSFLVGAVLGSKDAPIALGKGKGKGLKLG